MEMLAELFTSYWHYLLIAALAAYLISSVNTSIIVTRIVKHEDIRNLGSGNAGFTNVLRCVGKVPAIITFVGDFMKGVVSTLIPYKQKYWSTVLPCFPAYRRPFCCSGSYVSGLL